MSDRAKRRRIETRTEAAAQPFTPGAYPVHVRLRVARRSALAACVEREVQRHQSALGHAADLQPLSLPVRCASATAEAPASAAEARRVCAVARERERAAHGPQSASTNAARQCVHAASCRVCALIQPSTLAGVARVARLWRGRALRLPAEFSVYLRGKAGPHAFLALGLRDRGGALEQLVAAVDAVMRQCGAPAYHQQRLWHMSVAEIASGAVQCTCAEKKPAVAAKIDSARTQTKGSPENQYASECESSEKKSEAVEAPSDAVEAPSEVVEAPASEKVEESASEESASGGDESESDSDDYCCVAHRASWRGAHSRAPLEALAYVDFDALELTVGACEYSFDLQ